MIFAYTLELSGEFLAIDDSGRVAARTPIRGAVPIDTAGLDQMIQGLQEAQSKFCEQNGIVANLPPPAGEESLSPNAERPTSPPAVDL